MEEKMKVVLVNGANCEIASCIVESKEEIIEFVEDVIIYPGDKILFISLDDEDEEDE